MALASTAVDAPNRCDVVEDPPEAKHELIKLSHFLTDLSPADTIARTADYARDPGAYLKHVLGDDVFARRRDLICIPVRIDRDIYGTGDHKTHFQHHIARLLGKEHGLFFLTGVQAQLAALKVWCQRANNPKAAWHATSHLESAEEKAYELLYGLERTLLGSYDDRLPTVDEIQDVLNLPKESRPSVILIELPNRTLGCQTYEWDELVAISSACKEADVRLHCDGARIWEIEPYYQNTASKSFADIGELFDSVYVSFYKGLRGASGAMLLSNDEQVIEQAKKWRRRAGGNAFTLFYEVIDCQRGYNENIGTFAQKWEKMAEIIEAVRKATAEFKTHDGDTIVNFVPEKATCCQLRTIYKGYTAIELSAARDKVSEKLGVIIFERLMPKKTLDKQTDAERARKVDSNAQADSHAASQDDRRHVTEWMIVKQTLDLKTEVYVSAYIALCQELIHGRGQK